jgi:hypothetical protein
MSAVPSQYVVTVYIHPDHGPITPMQLDMLSVETMVMGLDANSNRDEARIRETAARIKAAFPDVDPYRNLGILTQLIRRLGHVGLFSGVVLRLPGAIPGPSQPVNPTEQEFAKLKDEIGNLKTELEELRQANEDLQKSPDLEADNVRLLRREQELLAMVKELRQDLVRAEHVKDLSVAEAKRATDRESALEQEIIDLRLKEDEARREHQMFSKLQAEVAALRMDSEELEKENEQLLVELKHCKQEKDLLKEQQQRRKPEQPHDPLKPDQGKNDWMD